MYLLILFSLSYIQPFICTIKNTTNKHNHNNNYNHNNTHNHNHNHKNNNHNNNHNDNNNENENENVIKKLNDDLDEITDNTKSFEK